MVKQNLINKDIKFKPSGDISYYSQPDTSADRVEIRTFDDDDIWDMSAKKVAKRAKNELEARQEGEIGTFSATKSAAEALRLRPIAGALAGLAKKEGRDDDWYIPARKQIEEAAENYTKDPKPHRLEDAQALDTRPEKIRVLATITESLRKNGVPEDNQRDILENLYGMRVTNTNRVAPPMDTPVNLTNSQQAQIG